MPCNCKKSKKTNSLKKIDQEIDELKIKAAKIEELYFKLNAYQKHQEQLSSLVFKD
jgi:hypothetical protein